MPRFIGGRIMDFRSGFLPKFGHLYKPCFFVFFLLRRRIFFQKIPSKIVKYARPNKMSQYDQAVMDKAILECNAGQITCRGGATHYNPFF